MASRKNHPTKPPLHGAPSPSANVVKDSSAEPGDKRRKTGPGAKIAVPPPAASRDRKQHLPPSSSDQQQSETESACSLDFKSREDVEGLLSEKMKGKNKMDFKGKSEQMMEYIKKLRTCIRSMMEQEDVYLQELSTLKDSIQTDHSNFSQMEAQMNDRIQELISSIEELTRTISSLQDSLKIEQNDKLVAIDNYNKEKESKEALEKCKDALMEELDKAKQDLLNANQQIKSAEDTNKRMQEYNASLQQYNTKLQNDAADKNDVNTKLQKDKSIMMEQLGRFRSKTDALQEQLNTARDSLQESIKNKEDLKNAMDYLRLELTQVKDEKKLQSAQIQSLTEAVEKYKEIMGKSCIELENQSKKAVTLEETCAAQQELIKTLQCKVDITNAKLQMADSTTLETRTIYEGQKKIIEDLQVRLTDAESRIADGEVVRKKLHNTILELKGNIRVFCRVRPLQDEESLGTTAGVVSYPSTTESMGRAIDLFHNGRKHYFSFDKVFNHEASQESVFEEVSQLVQSALDGYKVCIFAYGQTGSGKTYTMMGKYQELETKGLIPRSVEQIFQTSQSLQSQGWSYSMQASMLEIYNETIRDLLVPSRPSCMDATNKVYTITHDQSGNTSVTNLTVVDVRSTAEVSYLLNQAAQCRSVGKTQMNEQSSRSHFVFILRISGDNEGTDQHVQGVLNLIDLAGSERLDKSGATGERLKETQHINKSLLSLSECISAIAKKEDHIPFRNSKLTYLLQPCLGGESKTLMVVNISPETTSSGESKCSLQFAAKANSCEIGVPRRHGRP